MTNNISFRPMLVSDTVAVNEMIKSLYKSLGAPDDYITDQKIKATLNQFFHHSGSVEIEVFEVDATIAGYALLFSYWYNEFGGRVLNIDELFVKPEFRSRGIAEGYLSTLLKRKGYVAHTLEVLPQNEGAYKLYKRLGFEAKETVTLCRMTNL